MHILANGLFLFFQILERLIIFDIILSWLTLTGLRVRPRFLADIIDPCYAFIHRYIPTNIGIFDFTPIILIFVIIFMQSLILYIFGN